MFSSRVVLALLLACVWIACVHAAAFSPDGATQSSKSSKSSKADDLADFMQALSGGRRRDRKAEVDTNIINPFDIIGYIIKVITLPVWFPLRLIGTMAASLILILLGCQVIPYVKCDVAVTEDKVEEFINLFQKELGFFMTFGDTD